jgi:hypothetical protein
MTEITKFEIEFVERTKRILEEYRGEYKLSNAINCTLGLLVLPNERIINYDIRPWNTPVVDMEELAFLNIRVFEPIRRIENEERSYYPKTLQILLKKLRNGIAHQHIIPVNRLGLFVGIKIQNLFPDVKPILDTDVEFSRTELEKFAVFIADQYLAMQQEG